jgi:acyl carrier protein
LPPTLEAVIFRDFILLRQLTMTYTKEQILDKIREVLTEQFDVEPEAITPEARLREDLDIDSIDAVNLIIELKSFTVKKLAVESFRDVKTLGDLIEAVYQVVMEQESPA